MYLIIDEQYRVYKSPILSGYTRSQARKGNLSVINLRTMEGINSVEYYDETGEEWSDVQELPSGFRVEAA